MAGGPIELADLTRVVAHDLSELAVDLDELVSARLLVVQASDLEARYEVAHPLVAETLRDDLQPARRLMIHHQLGEALISQGRLGEAALHFARSAQVNMDEAIRVLSGALEEADGRGAYSESSKLLGVLADLLPAGDPRWAQVAATLRNWMFEHRVGTEAQTAATALTRIDGLPAGALDLRQRAAVKARLATLQVWGTGDTEVGEHTARGAIELFEQVGDGTRALLGRVELAYARGLAGDNLHLAEEAEHLASLAEEQDAPTAAEVALGAVGVARFLNGQFEEAEDATRRAIAVASVQQRPERVSRNYLNLGWALGYEGRREEAYVAFAAAKATFSSWRHGPTLGLEAMVRVLLGDFRGAVACAEQSAAMGVGLRRSVAQCAAGLALVETSSVNHAQQVLDDARSVYGPRPRWWFAGAYLRHGDGLLAWRQGRHDEALSALEEGASRLAGMGAPVLAAPVLLEVAQLAAECSDPARAAAAAGQLRVIAQGIDRPLYRAMSDLASGSAALARHQPVEAGDLALSAVQAASRVGHGVLRARALVLRGRCVEGTDRQEFLSALRESAALFDAAGAAWRHEPVIRLLRGAGSAGRRAAVSGSGLSALSARELDVVKLTRDRLTSKQIAEVLFLSYRTVESHLASVYVKLQVHSKTALLELLDAEEHVVG